MLPENKDISPRTCVSHQGPTIMHTVVFAERREPFLQGISLLIYKIGMFRGICFKGTTSERVLRVRAIPAIPVSTGSWTIKWEYNLEMV